MFGPCAPSLLDGTYTALPCLRRPVPGLCLSAHPAPLFPFSTPPMLPPFILHPQRSSPPGPRQVEPRVCPRARCGCGESARALAVRRSRPEGTRDTPDFSRRGSGVSRGAGEPGGPGLPARPCVGVASAPTQRPGPQLLGGQHLLLDSGACRAGDFTLKSRHPGTTGSDFWESLCVSLSPGAPPRLQSG